VKRTLLAVGALAALACACATLRESRAPVPLAFRDCGEPFECAELRVPIDRERADGPELALAVARARATGPGERIGVLVVNPGGPGLSAVDYLRVARSARHLRGLRERFDLVAFDTRGAGASAPLDCRASLDAWLAQDPTPEGDASWQSAVAAARALAEECARNHGELLPFVGTRDSAADLDALRAALGEQRISYLGFSYGTALGASYAASYPEGVRAMVLDGPIDPSLDLLAFAREQALAVESALAAYDQAAAEQGWHGTAVLESVSARVELAPLPSANASRAARASDVLYGSVEALTAPEYGWHELALALGSAQSGDGSGFVELSDRYFQRRSDGSTGLRVEAQLAVLCADLAGLESPQAYRDAAAGLAREAPHFGVANLLSHLPCAFWPEPARLAEPLQGAAARNVLVIAGRADPLTPYAWGERMAALLRGSTLLRVDTREHTSFGADLPCVDDAVSALLVSGERPAIPPLCP